jgi:hypothetical protein
VSLTSLQAVNAVERFVAASRAGDVEATTAEPAADVVMRDHASDFTVVARPAAGLMALGQRMRG